MNKPNDFENTKYEKFFEENQRSAEENKIIDIKKIVNEIFDFIYKGKYSEKLFSHPNNFEENFILKNLYEEAPLSSKEKNLKNCNEVFYEYLNTFKNNVNEKYFTLMLKFVILFRECYDKSKNKEISGDGTKKVGNLNPEGLPDLCNEFYGDFLEPNNFFGIEDQDQKDEIIELIQHFCIWLF